MTNDAIQRLREPAAWVMIGTAIASILGGLPFLIFSLRQLFDNDPLPVSASFTRDTFLHPVITALPVAAVLFAVYGGPRLPRARIIAMVALGVQGVAALLGLVIWITAFADPRTILEGKIHNLLYGVGELALVGAAAYVTFTVLRELPTPQRPAAAAYPGQPGYGHQTSQPGYPGYPSYAGYPQQQQPAQQQPAQQQPAQQQTAEVGQQSASGQQQPAYTGWTAQTTVPSPQYGGDPGAAPAAPAGAAHQYAGASATPHPGHHSAEQYGPQGHTAQYAQQPPGQPQGHYQVHGGYQDHGQHGTPATADAASAHSGYAPAAPAAYPQVPAAGRPGGEQSAAASGQPAAEQPATEPAAGQPAAAQPATAGTTQPGQQPPADAAVPSPQDQAPSPQSQQASSPAAPSEPAAPSPPGTPSAEEGSGNPGGVAEAAGDAAGGDAGSVAGSDAEDASARPETPRHEAAGEEGPREQAGGGEAAGRRTDAGRDSTGAS